MGVALWLGGGAVAYVLARIIPLRRPSARIAELVLALVTALVLGAVATAMDFGGWGEADWRAGGFALLGAFGAVGVGRAVRGETN